MVRERRLTGLEGVLRGLWCGRPLGSPLGRCLTERPLCSFGFCKMDPGGCWGSRASASEFQDQGGLRARRAGQRLQISHHPKKTDRRRLGRSIQKA